MGVTIYINDATNRVRVHDDDCDKIRQNGGGRNGYYKYFECYEDAWDYINDEYSDYDADDCYYCSPEINSCTDEEDY